LGGKYSFRLLHEVGAHDVSSWHFGLCIVDILRLLCHSAENKKSGVLKLFCAIQKVIVLPQQVSTAQSQRERIDLCFTVNQQQSSVVEHLKHISVHGTHRG